MLKGGEDPKFIARRLIVAASEDVGNADPRALEVAVAAGRAVEFVGPARGAHRARAGDDVHRAGAQVERLVPRHRRRPRTWWSARAPRARRWPCATRASRTPGASGTAPATSYPHDHPDAVLDESLLPEGLEGTRLLRADRPRAGGASWPRACATCGRACGRTTSPSRRRGRLLGGAPRRHRRHRGGGASAAGAAGAPRPATGTRSGSARAPWPSLLVLNEVVFHVVHQARHGACRRAATCRCT